MGRVISSPTASVGGETRAVTANYSAVAGDILLIDTSLASVGAEFTITLPGNPAIGDRINLIDAAGNCGTVKAIVSRNGNKIANVADDLDFDISNNALELIYTGSTYGWSILSN